MKKRIALLLTLALFLTACGSSSSTNLMEEVPARVVCLAEQPDCAAEATDFSLRLFQNALKDGENTLLSPLSVLAALGMTANGAAGDTLAQMEQTFGIPAQELNAYIYSYLDPQSEELKLANSIWLKDSPTLSVKAPFLETNANFYQADIFKAPFDSTTLNDINRWVSDHTDGMIPSALDQIPDSAVMYLINALAFDAKWETIYQSHQVREDTFTTESGEEQTAEFMHSQEFAYLEDENATGFLKYYEGRRYAFAALLPNEGISVADYAATLTGEALQALLSSPQEILTYAQLPKFETAYSAELSEILTAMGMPQAFDPNTADFSSMATSGNGNIYISHILHKTCISVAEEGTRAAAVTIVEPAAGAAIFPEYKTVTLNRPFLYMLIDCETNTPFFLGTLMDVE